MLVLVAVLFYMQKKHVSFTVRVFTPLGLGVVFGFVLQLFSSPDSEVIVHRSDGSVLLVAGM